MSDDTRWHTPRRVIDPLARLRAIYATAPGGIDAPYDDRLDVERRGGEGCAAYGELSEASTLRLMRWLAPTPDDALYDLGCGIGKLALIAAASTPIGRVVGVELSRHHHRVASDALSRLPELHGRVTFLHGDLRAVDLAPATIVYALATCFPDPVRAHIAERALAAPRVRALITTRGMPDAWAPRFEGVGHIKVVTSWSSSERLLVYAPRR
jgi:SAM-dependent methyltransferase